MLKTIVGRILTNEEDGSSRRRAAKWSWYIKPESWESEPTFFARRVTARCVYTHLTSCKLGVCNGTVDTLAENEEREMDNTARLRIAANLRAFQKRWVKGVWWLEAQCGQ